MADTLSQADIDALLTTFAEHAQESTDATPVSAVEATAETYDFSHPELLSRDQIRGLRTLHEGYAQALAKRLSTEFLTNVSAAVVSVDHLTYGEFLMLLPTPTVLSVIEIPSQEGNIAIEMNPNISFAFIDRLLGGTGQPLAKVRSLTAIEQGLMERVVGKCCQELSGIWAPIETLEFELQSIEGNPELARVVGPNEMVVLVSLELRMNDVTGMMNLCLPYVVMEVPIHKLAQGTTYQRSAMAGSANREALEVSVRRAPVHVDVELGTVELTLRELLEVETGDVLRLHAPCESGAQAVVEGVPRLSGRPGRHRGNLAFQVEAVHPPRDPDAKKRKGKG